jgi:hypothetical protein
MEELFKISESESQGNSIRREMANDQKPMEWSDWFFIGRICRHLHFYRIS